ncbi:MAG: hypothetical protein H0T42_09655 [Deltaproteobacteria bacterium]|nr:hypothetical protein [Deltaproteobacteria bacterium]
MLESAILIGGLAVFSVLRILLGRPRPARPEHAEVEVPAPVHTELAGIPEGARVTLVGRVRAAADAIEAPLSGQSCVAYVIRAKAWHSKKVPHLVGDVSKTTSQPFVLALTDGDVIVDCDIELELWTQVVTVSLYVDSTVFEEALMAEGDRVAVTGEIVRDRGAEGGYRDAPERTRIVAASRSKLIVGHAPRPPS